MVCLTLLKLQLNLEANLCDFFANRHRSVKVPLELTENFLNVCSSIVS